MRFFEAIRDGTGDSRELVGSVPLTTADDQGCVAVDALDDRTTLAAGVDLAVSHEGSDALTGSTEEPSGGTAATPTGVPVHLELATGP
ncbi:MAG: hypothetical protein ACI8UR_000859 [Natronomonas sp.]|uniref:hypothetical protein n=1 Tax=Natronomonas sp. TaxID=2184060 RepID=UPI00398962EB